jgi:uncharacterized protein
MRPPDFEQAKAYALRRLENELAPDLFYHSLQHTRDDVWPAARRLAALAGIKGEELLLLETAALYHDLGFVKQTTEHEKVSAGMAQEVLPHFGYNRQQVKQIKGMIMATRLPQTPQNFLEELMADADLDTLGRKDFFITNEKLRLELKAYGRPIMLHEWHDIQLNFLKNHNYFTVAAKSLRTKQKQKNMQRLRELLNVPQEMV